MSVISLPFELSGLRATAYIWALAKAHNRTDRIEVAIVKHCFLSSTWKALDGIHINIYPFFDMTVVTFDKQKHLFTHGSTNMWLIGFSQGLNWF